MLRRIVLAVALGLAVLLGGVATPAQAAGWTTLHRWPAGSVFLACKYTESGPYGPVWQVRLVLAHHPNESVQHLRAHLTVRRMTSSGSFHPWPRHRWPRQSEWDGRPRPDLRIGAKCGPPQVLPVRRPWSWGLGDEMADSGDADNTALTDQQLMEPLICRTAERRRGDWTVASTPCRPLRRPPSRSRILRQLHRISPRGHRGPRRRVQIRHSRDRNGSCHHRAEAVARFFGKAAILSGRGLRACADRLVTTSKYPHLGTPCAGNRDATARGSASNATPTRVVTAGDGTAG